MSVGRSVTLRSIGDWLQTGHSPWIVSLGHWWLTGCIVLVLVPHSTASRLWNKKGRDLSYGLFPVVEIEGRNWWSIPDVERWRVEVLWRIFPIKKSTTGIFSVTPLYTTDIGNPGQWWTLLPMESSPIKGVGEDGRREHLWIEPVADAGPRSVLMVGWVRPTAYGLVNWMPHTTNRCGTRWPHRPAVWSLPTAHIKRKVMCCRLKPLPVHLPDPIGGRALTQWSSGTTINRGNENTVNPEVVPQLLNFRNKKYESCSQK